jgi:ATP-dependent protease ClpP protease subunit
VRRLVSLFLVAALGCAAAPRPRPATPAPTPEVAPQHLELIGPVDELSVTPLIVGLIKAVQNREPVVHITIDSPGGGVYAGLRLIYAMRAAEREGVRTVCVADGYAASMAAVILESCSVRAMTKRSAILFHSVSTSGCEGNADALRRCANEIDDLTKLLVIIATQKLKIPLTELQRRTADRDYWLGWEEAVEIGAVDIVIP